MPLQCWIGYLTYKCFECMATSFFPTLIRRYYFCDNLLINCVQISNANQGLKAREGGRKTAQKSRECKYVANKSHNTLLRCLRQ